MEEKEMEEKKKIHAKIIEIGRTVDHIHSNMSLVIRELSELLDMVDTEDRHDGI